MDHDRLFKELLSNFFVEFVALFLPEISDYLDGDVELHLLDKEVFTDVTIGDSHLVDLVMKAKVRGKDAFFLIHVESQSRSDGGFPGRMFRYFARLTEKYDLPVYPVVIYSYKAPRRAEPNLYEVVFPDRTVLRFEYAVIQLSRMSWREFVERPNPVASALMARMRMAVEERPRVKLECLRMLAKLKLDPAKSKLIGGFIDSYLVLTAQEMKQYEREFSNLAGPERKETMALVSSWEQRGIDKGLTKGKEGLLVRQIGRHLFQGSMPSEAVARLDRLTADQLDDLGEALLDFETVADLDRWFESRGV